MWNWINRGAAIAMYLYICLVWQEPKQGADIFVNCLVGLFPLLIIWFSEALGELTGFEITLWDFTLIPFPRFFDINIQTPGLIVAIFGWVVLTYPIWIYWLSRPIAV